MIPYFTQQLHRKVVIYARVSTDHDAQLSALENQLDWYKPLLDLHPEWELVGQYIDEGQDVPESVIEAFVVKILASEDGFDWYLRFDGDPDRPLHCQLQGKRKSTTKIMVSLPCSPAMDEPVTGCYQGLMA